MLGSPSYVLPNITGLCGATAFASDHAVRVFATFACKRVCLQTSLPANEFALQTRSPLQSLTQDKKKGCPGSNNKNFLKDSLYFI